jgi:hypothetical protein
MRIDLACSKCGKNRFALDGEIADGTQVHCETCGQPIGTMAELKERVAEAVLKHSAFRDQRGSSRSPTVASVCNN